MKIKKGISIAAILLFPLSVIIINETAPAPQDSFQKEFCTRYCHSVKCLHFQKEESKYINQLYHSQIKWLKNNPLGLSYKSMNLLLYVILMPALILFLTWTFFKKSNHGTTN